MNWHYCDTIDQRPGEHGLSTFCLIQSFVVCKHNAWTLLWYNAQCPWVLCIWFDYV